MKWEKLIGGMTETWKAKVEGGYLYRVDHYIQYTNEHGDDYYIIGATAMTFVSE